jgi:hypothetical protein
MMDEDYCSAALRHHRDATFLSEQGRLDNAAYLAGYVVECSLKLAIACGERLGGRSLGHDLPNIAGPALVLATVLAPGIQRYQVECEGDVDHVLRFWKPELRYTASGQVTQEELAKLIQGGRVCLNRIVLPLILDGILGIPK